MLARPRPGRNLAETPTDRPTDRPASLTARSLSFHCRHDQWIPSSLIVGGSAPYARFAGADDLVRE